MLKFLLNEVPGISQDLRQELANVKEAQISALLRKANLVTHEEYVVQVLLLQRLIEKTKELEQRVKKLEQAQRS